MELTEARQQVHDWISQFEEGYWHPLSLLARLTEEVGELARDINHHWGQKPKKPHEPPGDIGAEMADILFVLLAMANAMDVDINTAFADMMAKMKERDKNRWTPKEHTGHCKEPI